MKSKITYIFLLIAFSVTTLPGCYGNREMQAISDPYVVISTHIASQSTPNAILKETKQVLDSLTNASPEKLRPMVQAICRSLLKMQKNKEAISVAALAYGIDETQNSEIASRLLTSTLLPGIKAPQIAGLSTAQWKPSFTLLLFHESKCRSCGKIIWEIKEHFNELQNNGVRVVTISTDTDQKKWNEYAVKLPWPDKLCDFKGFHSPAMIDYGVAATPTLYLIDENGKVIDQYASFEDSWKRMAIQVSTNGNKL